MVTIVEAPIASSARLSGPYKAWVLLLVTVIYAFSFMDRVLMSIAAPAVKAQMHLSDAQLGLLIGLAFALLYTLLGIPIARLAERFNRVIIVAVTATIWSLMTVGCGTAASYVQLLAFRTGVGIGEAGATPAAYSLLSDYFPDKRRSLVFALYAAGVPFGVLIASFVAAPLVKSQGWQHAFFYVGAPGVVLGLLAYLTIKEPARAAATKAGGDSVPKFSAVLRAMASTSASRHMIVAVILGMFAMSAIILFLPIYFARVYGMNFAQAGISFGLIGGVGGIIGNVISGYLADRLGKRNPVWNGRIPALGCMAASVLAGLAFLQPQAAPCVALLVVFAVCMNFWNGPSFAVILSLLEPRMRATASALTLSAMALLGQGLGPWYSGVISDVFARHLFGRPDFAQMCVLARHAAPGTPAQVPADIAALCHSATTTGLQYAMLTIAPVLLWAAVHYRIAGRKFAALKAQPA
ncbi:MFS transporter [Paraburkholderia sp. CNPSo 3157]|uniref:MFS transporter n=1 Tax=Paraburkholderia franconis TaxID=2654983 RepID=A0A7X1TK88_9BURK|nr:MFS transporter [Paraburkholderia franconis]MPW22331.1 MFS transporter [Paraburkholderia franconis]